MIVENITDLIGNTPMIKIPAHLHGLKNIDLYGKLEMMNPFGSVKDRIAWGMIEEDLDHIKQQGQRIFENSSGNTAKALCAIAAAHGIDFKLVSAIAKVPETKDQLRMMGAEIEEFAAASDCFDPSDPNDPQFLIEKAVREAGGKIYFPSQFTNEKNPETHERTTAKEIIDDLGTVDYFISGLGTTGSTLGITRGLKAANHDLKAIGLTSSKGQFVPGIRAMDQMWESGLFRQDNYDDIIEISEKEALDGMLSLNRGAGIMCGPSAGANYQGAVNYLRGIDDELTSRKSAVFIVCDRVEWYLSYIRERRPEWFGEQAKPETLFHFEMQGAPTEYQLNLDAFESYRQEKQPLIIDIRSHMSYKMGHIEGAMNIPFETFEQLIDNAKPFPENQPLLLVCAVGEKTGYHAAYLQKQGYEALSLEGGMLGYRSLGLGMARSLKAAA